MRLMRLLRTADPRIISLYNAFFAIAWGLWLLLPFQTFSVSSVYRTMAAMGPEWVWGGVYAGLGLLHVRAVLRRTNRWCKSFSYIAVFQWLLLAAMYGISDYRGLGVVIYTLVALAAVWVCVRLGMIEVLSGQGAIPRE